MTMDERTSELTAYRAWKYLGQRRSFSQVETLLRDNQITTFAGLDAWLEATPRRVADECCDSCRALPGKGPWCPRCGAEMPDTPLSEDGRFTTDVCPPCEVAIVWGGDNG